MLRLIGWIIKCSLFAAIILVLGSLIHWRGRTVSDQLKLQLSHAEHLGGLVHKAESMAMGFPNPAPESARTRHRLPVAAEALRGSAAGERAVAPRHLTSTSNISNISNTARTASTGSTPTAPAPEQIAPSERQKLRALIRELNGAREDQVTGNP
jgi:hypothetical protein